MAKPGTSAALRICANDERLVERFDLSQFTAGVSGRPLKIFDAASRSRGAPIGAMREFG
jgi:hypothetical protein